MNSGVSDSSPVSIQTQRTSHASASQYRNGRSKQPIKRLRFLRFSFIQRTQIQASYRKGQLSQRSAIAEVRGISMQNRKTKTNTNPSPDPNRYRRRCPDPNARIQKLIHYMAIATFAIADLCDSTQLKRLHCVR